MSAVQGARDGGSGLKSGEMVGLYSKVQCIMGNGHIGIPLCTDRPTDTTENITFP